MKINFLSFFILISLTHQYAEPIVGIYRIKSNESFSTIELKNDSTFTYKDRGISVWGWDTFSGTWQYSKNILTLKEEFREFDTMRYLLGDYDDELYYNSIEVKIRYHYYTVVEDKLFAGSENLIDSQMIFHKIKKND